MRTGYLCWSLQRPHRYWRISPDSLQARFVESGAIVNYHCVSITSGTGCDASDALAPDVQYRWAQSGDWRVLYWPDGGGSQAYVNTPGIGFVVDVDDNVPQEVYILLLSEIGAPLVGSP
jgi:hypothetical protein